LRNRLEILQVPGVVRLVVFNNVAAPLPIEDINTLRSGLNRSSGAEPHPYLTVGRRVRIVRGPFEGLEGILIRRKGRSRVVLTLHLIQRSVVVDLHANASWQSIAPDNGLMISERTQPDLIEAGGAMPSTALPLTAGSLLARNTVWNLIGSGAPMIVAFFCIPILIRGLGKERFGVLMLAWALIGYANLFDFGLGRALTQLVARKLGAGKEPEISPIAWGSLLLMLVLGLVGGVVVALFSPWLANSTSQSLRS
jgi:hypothetical protein